MTLESFSPVKPIVIEQLLPVHLPGLTFIARSFVIIDVDSRGTETCQRIPVIIGIRKTNVAASSVVSLPVTPIFL